jgi:hypothetical protein
MEEMEDSKIEGDGERRREMEGDGGRRMEGGRWRETRADISTY